MKKGREISTEDILSNLPRRGALSMFQLAKKMKCLTKPMPTTELRNAVWRAASSGLVKFGRNWEIRKG